MLIKAIQAVGLTLMLASAVVAGPLENGLSAAKRGDYPAALRLWWPLAEQGDVEAQWHLGALYENGQGVPQDYSQAIRWYRDAAEQGYAQAQYSLGVMYQDGLGIPQDEPQAAQRGRSTTDWEAIRRSGMQSARRRGMEFMDAKQSVDAQIFQMQQAEIQQAGLLATIQGSDGAPSRYVPAHMWFNLAAAGGYVAATRARDLIATKMTPAQIAEAQNLAREWQPK